MYYNTPDPFFSIVTLFVGLIGFFFVTLLLLTGIRIANEYERAVILRFGKYVGTRGPGLYFLIPIIERAIKVELRVFNLPIERQELISSDNVPVQVNAVVWAHVVDPVKSVLQIEDVRQSIQQLAATQLRVTLGQYSLDSILKNQDTIAAKMKTQIDTLTEQWGVQITSVEMKNIEIPKSMQRVMAQEAEAGREKLARLIKADAELEASRKFAEAGRIIAESPHAMELRRLQTITEVGAEQNTTVIVAMPMEFIRAADAVTKLVAKPQPAPTPAPIIEGDHMVVEPVAGQ